MNLMQGFEGLLLYFAKGPFVQEVEGDTNGMREENDDSLDELEDLLLFVDTADKEDGQFGGHLGFKL